MFILCLLHWKNYYLFLQLFHMRRCVIQSTINALQDLSIILQFSHVQILLLLPLSLLNSILILLQSISKQLYMCFVFSKALKISQLFTSDKNINSQFLNILTQIGLQMWMTKSDLQDMCHVPTIKPSYSQLCNTLHNRSCNPPCNSSCNPSCNSSCNLSCNPSCNLLHDEIV